jgi:hypothetical protein
MYSATNVAGPWALRVGYTDTNGSFQFIRWQVPHLFFRLVDLDEQ